MVAWTPDEGTNADELGAWFQGDIRLTPGQDSKNASELRTTIQDAMDSFHANTCINFVPRSTEQNYTYFTADAGGCYSYIGMVGGRQTINLQESTGGTCNVIGIVEHEMLHALGFFHMLNNYERDDFVQINWENIASGSEQAFFKYDEDQTTEFGYTYDYESLMHFGRTYCSGNGRDTITPYDPNANIGQREGLSPIDIGKVQAMYEDICSKPDL